VPALGRLRRRDAARPERQALQAQAPGSVLAGSRARDLSPDTPLEQGATRSLVEAVALLAVVLAAPAEASWSPVAFSTPQAGVVASGIAVLAAVAVMTALGGSARTLGLGAGRVGRDLAAGLLAVVPTYALAIGVTAPLAALSIWAGGESLESLAAAKRPIVDVVSGIDPLLVLPTALFVAFYEEVAFRGFLLGRLATVAGRSAGAIGSALAFGLLHYASQGWLGVAQTTCVGLALATLTLRRRSLWPAIACHAGIDSLGFALVLAMSSFAGRVG
jgi:membrane protease YdiL (CAAX protease family)